MKNKEENNKNKKLHSFVKSQSFHAFQRTLSVQVFLVSQANNLISVSDILGHFNENVGQETSDQCEKEEEPSGRLAQHVIVDPVETLSVGQKCSKAGHNERVGQDEKQNEHEYGDEKAQWQPNSDVMPFDEQLYKKQKQKVIKEIIITKPNG